MSISGQLIFWIVLPVLSALFSGMEMAFLTSDKLQVALSKKDKGPMRFMLNFVFSHPRQFLSTLSFANLVVLALYVLLSWQIFTPPLMVATQGNSLLSSTIIVIGATVVILLTGEFLPRLLTANNPDLWAKIFIVPSFGFYILLYPFTRFFVNLSKAILSVLGVKSANTDGHVIGRVELNSYVKKGIEEMAENSDVESEVKIFKNALDFSQMRLRDCMVPRAEIVAINKDADIEKLKELFIETGISRILVYNEDMDDIVGYIHMWEMFNNPSEWNRHIASVLFVPESMQADKMLNDLMQQHKSIAVVVDEFGGTSGIVTIEDLVEEIFGEIEDEYDSQDRFVKQENENEFVLSGRVEIDMLNEEYALDLPESEDYSTVAGFLLHYAQRFPKTYETIVIGKYTFKILKVTVRKIEVVRLTINQKMTN